MLKVVSVSRGCVPFGQVVSLREVVRLWRVTAAKQPPLPVGHHLAQKERHHLPTGTLLLAYASFSYSFAIIYPCKHLYLPGFFLNAVAYADFSLSLNAATFCRAVANLSCASNWFCVGGTVISPILPVYCVPYFSAA